jgi:hypothetical protein
MSGQNEALQKVRIRKILVTQRKLIVADAAGD